MPAGFVAIALLLLLTVIGILAARFIRQPVVAFAPALALILINLKA